MTLPPQDIALIEEVENSQNKFAESFNGADAVKGYRHTNQLLNIIERQRLALELATDKLLDLNGDSYSEYEKDMTKIQAILNGDVK